MTVDGQLERRPSSRTERLLPAALRVTAGLLWLSNVGWKTPPDFGRSAERCSGLCRFVEAGVDDAVIPPWGWVLDTIVSPNLSAFGYLTLVTEFLLAVLLLSGALTRAAALVGLGQSLAIGLTVANAEGEWYWSYLLMAALHVAVFAMAAGRSYGVDALLRQRAGLPRWVEAST
ncbi:MAG: TQO small subunit DoxD [Geodermatophilaceae bacterium]|nr:TQO small subunit DoxD [Geodermatophilaceae bacterium]